MIVVTLLSTLAYLYALTNLAIFLFNAPFRKVPPFKRTVRFSYFTILATSLHAIIKISEEMIEWSDVMFGILNPLALLLLGIFGKSVNQVADLLPGKRYMYILILAVAIIMTPIVTAAFILQ